jgi:hypothetical protein
MPVVLGGDWICASGWSDLPFSVYILILFYENKKCSTITLCAQIAAKEGPFI